MRRPGDAGDDSSGERMNRSKKSDGPIIAMDAVRVGRREGAVRDLHWISIARTVVNFVAGRFSRAPVFVRRLGLKWLWRIKEEPVLWRRYAGDASALSRLMVMRVLPGLTYRVLGVFAKRMGLRNLFSARSFDAVLHFAGLKAVGESVGKPLLYYDNNVTGTVSLLESMAEAGVKTLVFSSSATVYGDPSAVPITEGFPLNATNPYGRSKLMIEDILRDAARSDPQWRIALLRLSHRRTSSGGCGGVLRRSFARAQAYGVARESHGRRNVCRCLALAENKSSGQIAGRWHHGGVTANGAMVRSSDSARAGSKRRIGRGRDSYFRNDLLAGESPRKSE